MPLIVFKCIMCAGLVELSRIGFKLDYYLKWGKKDNKVLHIIFRKHMRWVLRARFVESGLGVLSLIRHDTL